MRRTEESARNEGGCLGYSISTRTGKRRNSLSKHHDGGSERGDFSFEPIVSPFGTFAVSVMYRKNCNFELATAANNFILGKEASKLSL